MTTLVFETHSWSEDNDLGVASGWNHSRLSARGRKLARELGKRRQNDGVDVVFVSDLRRAVETAEMAFEGTLLTVLYDWRLRECNYGDFNGASAAALHRDRHQYLQRPYPKGESWQQALDRVGRFMADVRVGWPDRRVLVIGHVATRWAFDHLINGVPLETLSEQEFGWREGWVYQLT